jgi:CheY-like chemotaxis protein
MKNSILIVDDEKLQLEAIQSHLEAAGFDVELSPGGRDALDRMTKTQYDVVLLDIRMPEVDGLELLNHIVKHFPSTEVVMMTGFADFMTAVECMKNGARDYLVKPIHPTELVTRINSLLRERELRQSLQELQQHAPSTALYNLLSSLNTITSIIDHVGNGRSGTVSKEQGFLLNYARATGERTLGIIRRVSGLTSGSDDSAERGRKRTDIALLTDSVCVRYEILARPKGLKIYRSISRPLPDIICASDDIIQALNNIFDYSLEHTVGSGTISVAAEMQAGEEQPGTVVLTVNNGGLGKPGSGLLQLLGKNGDGNTHLSPDLGITEIGLAVSKRIFEDHGGSFEARFDASGGNAFVVTLPAAGT